MERYKRAGDRESQARTGGTVRVLPAEELVEDALAVFCRDARAVVTHFYAKRASSAMRRDEDRSAAGRVANGVHDEIRKSLLHLAAVRDDAGRIRVDVERDPLPLLLGEDGVVRDHVADERDRVDLLLVERDLSLFETCHLQELRREVLEAADVSLGALGELALGRGERSGALSEQKLYGAAHDRERAAEIVGHRRKELALDPVGLPKRRGLDRLTDEFFSLSSQVLELAQQT